MKQCDNPLMGLECDHMVDTESAVVYCKMTKCVFKKINYEYEMTHNVDIDSSKCK